MSIKNRIAYYCLIVVSIYLIIHDLCSLYVVDFFGVSFLFPFGEQTELEYIFIVQDVFTYLAELFRAAWVVLFLLVWKQTKPKLLLSLMIAALVLPVVLSLVISADVLRLVVQIICILELLVIAVVLMRMCDREYKPLLIGQIVLSSTYILSFVLLLIQTPRMWATVKVLFIIYLALSILAIIFASGRLREKSAAS